VRGATARRGGLCGENASGFLGFSQFFSRFLADAEVLLGHLTGKAGPKRGLG
jgi:hypothetical protein